MRILRGIGLGLLVLLGVFVVAIVIVPLVWPLPARAAGPNPRSLADADSRFVEIGPLEVHVKEAGNGQPPIVLLHGFLSSTRTWEGVVPQLADNHRLLWFDRPAFGLTSRPTSWVGANPYTPEFQADLTLQLMDRAGMERAVFMGNSAGGSLALWMALRHPERVQALVLVAPAVYTGGGSPEWIKPVLATPQLQRIGPPLIEGLFRGFVDGPVGNNAAYARPEREAQADRDRGKALLSLDNVGAALLLFTRASRDLALAPRPSELRVPTLVVTGDTDRVVPTAESIRLASEIPGAQLAILADCGHVPQEECPQALLAVVEPFLAALR